LESVRSRQSERYSMATHAFISFPQVLQMAPTMP
jgi:hypothetical protein